MSPKRFDGKELPQWFRCLQFILYKYVSIVFRVRYFKMWKRITWNKYIPQWLKTISMRCFILELPQYGISLPVFSFDQTFPEERRVFLRDNHSGMYRTDIYFLCKTFAQVSVGYVPETPLIFFKKITKIVRALWFVGRRVCVRVYVIMVVTWRCFAFLALITQARIWKSFWVENSTSLLYLPIPSSAETWKIFTNMLCQFFSLKLTF